ncbi:MAG: TrkA family potassium uptake protein [Planctomycetes bacterium]|nr:TrkA family potassium uptake protein [Planctomycetota bacterium]
MKQVCVIGLSQFGSHLARQLVRFGCQVLVIDRNEARVNDIRDDVHRAVIGDARSFEMLESAIPDTVDEVIISLGEANIEPSILCALHLKQIGVTCILSTARNDDHAQILRSVGATEIIFPEQDTAERTARRVANPALRDLFPLSEDYRIMEIAAPPALHRKSLLEANLRKEFDLLVLAVRPQSDEQFQFLPRADTIIKPGDVLMVLGRELDLGRFAGLE